MSLVSEIKRMIKSDVEHAHQLKALLQQETQAAKHRNFDLMNQILAQKQPLLSQLKANGEKRETWLKAARKKRPNADWNELLQQLQQVEAQKGWQEAKSLIEECQSINNINGKLIQRGMQTHQKLLNIMRGNSGQEDLYTAQGTTQTGLGAASYTQA